MLYLVSIRPHLEMSQLTNGFNNNLTVFCVIMNPFAVAQTLDSCWDNSHDYIHFTVHYWTPQTMMNLIVSSFHTAVFQQIESADTQLRLKPVAASWSSISLGQLLKKRPKEISSKCHCRTWAERIICTFFTQMQWFY